ncbi:MAG: DUF4175 family protein [Candidatus Ozemobacteraceae bacterium]
MDDKQLIRDIEEYSRHTASVEKLFSAYRRSRQTRVFLARFGAGLAALVGMTLLFLLVERTPLQSEAARYFCSLGFYTLLIGAVIWVLRTLFRPPVFSRLALELEAVTPEARSVLISAIEFIETPSAPGMSPALRKLTVAQAAGSIHPEDGVRALARFTLWPAWVALFFLAGIFGIWHAISPIEVERGTARLLKPYVSLAPWSGLTVVVYPGNLLIARGQSVQISAIPSHIPEREPVLTLFVPDGQVGNATEMYPDEAASTSRFVFTLNGLQESTDYQVSAEGFISERFSIKVMPRPEIKSLRVTLHQPAYLGSGPLTLPEGTGDATVLVGTRIELAGVCSQPLGSAVVSLTPGASLTCTIRGDAFRAAFDVATTTRYSLMIANTSGLANENPVKYQITAVQDAPPTVTILKPGVDITFPNSKRLDLKVSAKDDFGLVSVILQYGVGDRKNTIPQNLKADFSPAKDFEVEFPWMLDTVAVLPGTEITYFVKAEDNLRPVPHVATSPTFKVTMPSMYDAYRGTDEQHGDVTKKLEDILESQKMRRDALQKAYEEIKYEGKLDEEMQKQLEDQIRQGEERQKESQELMQNVNNLQEKLKDNPFSSPEALERMQKVQELLNEVLDDEAKKLMKQLRESLQNMKVDPKEIEKYEETFKMEDYLKGLDRSIELLKNVREEMKMNAMGQALQDLLKRQEAIASETSSLEQQKKKQGSLSPEEESKLRDLQKQQEKIKDELGKMQKDAQEMAAQKPKEGEQQDPAKEDLKNIADKMKSEDHQKMSDEIKKNLEEKKLDEAQKSQQKMLTFLKSLAKQGEQMCRQCSGGQQPQLDLSRFIRKALNVSQDQETLMERLDGLPGQFMRGHVPTIEGRIDEVSILQLLVKRQAQDLEDALEAYVRSSFTMSPTVLQPIAGVQGMFSEIVKLLEDRQIDRSRQSQREIIRRFNMLAIELMKAQDQQQQQSGAQGSQASAMQQFKELTRRQLSMYQQSQRQNSSPQDKQSMEQMQRMAMEQRMVREQLERLMRESREQMKTLGRMDEVTKEMKDLETKILDPKLRREVAEKQKSIYERMLRAQKSIRNRDEESEERKSQQAHELVQTEPDKPLPTAGSDTRDLSRDYLSESREGYPKTYENDLREYYRSLNLYQGDLPAPSGGVAPADAAASSGSMIPVPTTKE